MLRGRRLLFLHDPVVRFDVVKASNQFQVKQSLRHLYQAEVLVPSPLPPEFIVDFRKIRADKRFAPAAPRVITTTRARLTLSLSGEWLRMVRLRTHWKKPPTPPSDCLKSS